MQNNFDDEFESTRMQGTFGDFNKQTKQDSRLKHGEHVDDLQTTGKGLERDATSTYLTRGLPSKPGPKTWHLLAPQVA